MNVMIGFRIFDLAFNLILSDENYCLTVVEKKISTPRIPLSNANAEAVINKISDHR